jgi:site-specific DNA-methyltransferase (adenine-specific)
MDNLKIEYLPVDSLEPYEKNTRKHQKEDISQIVKSIKKFGFDDPIGIWSDHNVIVEGHGRLMAAKKLGMKEVPVIRLDHLTDEQRRQYGIMHNRTAELSVWDMDMLAEELKDLDMSDFNIDFGIPEEDPDKDKTVVEVDAPSVDDIEEPVAKLGDIWQLGNHRVMCGDSTMIDDVEKLMDGVKADLVVTDPPYNVNYEGSAGKIKNDNMENDKFREFLYDTFSTMNMVMNPGAPFYIWHADSEGYNFRGACADVGLRVRECLIWVKNSLVLGRSDYQWQHEPCLYGWKEGAAHTWNGKRKQTTVMESLDLMDEERLRETIKELLSENYDTTILRENKPLNNKLHPTMKPVRLIAKLIQNSSNKGGAVLDLFGGSGTTMIAAEQLDRNAYLMELDPKFVDVIIKRWEDFTGRKAVLLNGQNEG